MASTLSSAPSFFSFSPQTTLTCPVPALTFSLPLLLLLLVPLSLSPPPEQRQWLQGLTIFIATFLCHMIPQCCVWSQQKALTLPGLNIRCGQKGNSWRRGWGRGGRRKEDGKTDSARPTETGSRQEEAEMIIQEISSFTSLHPEWVIFAMRT